MGGLQAERLCFSKQKNSWQLAESWLDEPWVSRLKAPITNTKQLIFV